MVGEAVWRYGFALLPRDSKVFVIQFDRYLPHKNTTLFKGSKIWDMAVDNIVVTSGMCKGEESTNICISPPFKFHPHISVIVHVFICDSAHQPIL